MIRLDFGSGHNPLEGWLTCDCTGNPMLDYHFDKEAYRIDSTTGEFDLVLCRNVIHHVPDLSKLFNELARILKLGGKLVIVEPTEASYPANFFLDCLWYRYIIPRKEVWFAPSYRDYKKVLTNCQMRIILTTIEAEKETVVAERW